MNKLSAYLPSTSLAHWSSGCEHCTYGVVSAPELTGACELYLERLVQALAKEIVFCECQAGTRYRVHLLNHHQKLKEQAKRHPLMADYARRGTHLDIEVAKAAMEKSYVYAAAPTVHGATE